MKVWFQIALCIGILATLAGLSMILLWWAGFQTPVQKAPFGMTPVETGSYGQLGAMFLALQASFYQKLQAGLNLYKTQQTALFSLVGIGFAYGVFHAAGPGHGKALITGYLMTRPGKVMQAWTLSFAAALVQALMAIAIVVIGAGLFNTTSAFMLDMTSWIETVSFVMIMILGGITLWRKAGLFVQHWQPVKRSYRLKQHGCEPGLCTHLHPQDLTSSRQTMREKLVLVFAAGARPCAGALIILVFALSGNMMVAGMASVFAMALGTALTTGLIAALAVFAKHRLLRISQKSSDKAVFVALWLELMAAGFICILGLFLLTGLWASGG